MSLDLHPKLTKLLYRAPHFGAAGSELFRNTRPADNDSGVIAEQADNAAKARVGRIVVKVDIPFCAALSDEGIMREWRERNKRQAATPAASSCSSRLPVRNG